jgi:hypothetical protein
VIFSVGTLRHKDCTFYVVVKSGGPIQKNDRLGFISFDKAFSSNNCDNCDDRNKVNTVPSVGTRRSVDLGTTGVVFSSRANFSSSPGGYIFTRLPPDRKVDIKDNHLGIKLIPMISTWDQVDPTFPVRQISPFPCSTPAMQMKFIPNKFTQSFAARTYSLHVLAITPQAHSQTRSRALTTARFHSYSLTLSRALAHAHSLTCTRSRALAHAHSLTRTRSRALAHVHFPTRTRSRALAHAHSPTRTYLHARTPKYK